MSRRKKRKDTEEIKRLEGELESINDILEKGHATIDMIERRNVILSMLYCKKWIK